MTREVLGRRLQILGIIGLIAASVVAVGGWIAASSASTAANETIGPFVDVADDLANTIGATVVLVDRTTEAIVSIENTTRSVGRTLGEVSRVTSETADLVEGDIAGSLDSVVDTLPAIISTANVVDNTMRALSFIGVDYDPDEPLDDALRDLERSISPLPDQIRDQAESLRGLTTDIDDIQADSGALAAVLLTARIDLMDAGDLLDSAAENARAAVDQMRIVESDVGGYATLARIVALAVAVALAAASTAPLLIGRSYLSEDANA